MALLGDVGKALPGILKSHGGGRAEPWIGAGAGSPAGFAFV